MLAQPECALEHDFDIHWGRAAVFENDGVHKARDIDIAAVWREGHASNRESTSIASPGWNPPLSMRPLERADRQIVERQPE